jgi:hypothetical protein
LLSEPNEVSQICAVVDSMEMEMKTVDFNDLAYFVEHQRPMILQQQIMPPPITVVPIWRQKKAVVSKEGKDTAAISSVPQKELVNKRIENLLKSISLDETKVKPVITQTF